jgi:hypothetical protein
MARAHRLVLVERSLQAGMAEAAVRRAAGAGASCLEAHDSRFLHSYVSADGRRTICVFEAPDAESVRSVQRRLGMPFDAAWPSTLHSAPPIGAGGPMGEGPDGRAPADGGPEAPES